MTETSANLINFETCAWCEEIYHPCDAVKIGDHDGTGDIVCMNCSTQLYHILFDWHKKECGYETVESGSDSE